MVYFDPALLSKAERVLQMETYAEVGIRILGPYAAPGARHG